MQAGAGMIDALETWYAECQLNMSSRNKREYMVWRLRLHLKFNDDPKFLEKLDETFNIGLHDETVGKLLWDIDPPAQETGNFTSGYNWRRDSGYALRGRSSRRKHQEDLAES